MTSAPALIEQLTASGLSIKVVGPNEVEIEGPEAALADCRLRISSATSRKSSKR